MALFGIRVRRVLWFGLFVWGTGAMLITSKAALLPAEPSNLLPAFALLAMQNGSAVFIPVGRSRKWPRQPLRWWLSLLPSALLLGASQFAVLRVLPRTSVATVIVFRALGLALVSVGDLLKGCGARQRLLSAAGTISLGAALSLAANPPAHAAQWAWLGAHSALWATDRLTEGHVARVAATSPAELSFAKHAATLPLLALAQCMAGGGGRGALLPWLVVVPKSTLLCAVCAGTLVSRCYVALSKLSSFTKITLVGGAARLATALAGAAWFGEAVGALQLFGVATAVFGTLMAAFVPRSPLQSAVTPPQHPRAAALAQHGGLSRSHSMSAPRQQQQPRQQQPKRGIRFRDRTPGGYVPCRAADDGSGSGGGSGSGALNDDPDTPTFLRQELAELHTKGKT